MKSNKKRFKEKKKTILIEVIDNGKPLYCKKRTVGSNKKFRYHKKEAHRNYYVVGIDHEHDQHVFT